MASGLSFLALGIKTSSKSKAATKTEIKVDNDDGRPPLPRTVAAAQKAKKFVFVALMCAFLFLYVGAEIALGAYLTIFCVRSSSVCKV